VDRCARARLASARTYWLSTVGRNGGPHAVPVWGAAIDGTLYLYSERRTAKARNLAADPRVVLHLESGDDVVIVHGALDDVGQPSDQPAVDGRLYGAAAGVTVTLAVPVAFRAALFPQDTR
jgi:hypothetical protein